MSVAALDRRAAVPRRVLPGLGPSLGFTVFYLSLIVLIPLAGLLVKASGIGGREFMALMTSPRVLAAFRVSFGIALAAALVNGIIGTLIAWVLVRYRFLGRPVLDALVDLPFALPTAVAGVALTAVYSDTGWIGGLLAPLGIDVAYTRLGIFVALVFIGLPFVVRTLQPVLAELEREAEEAGLSLGASGLQIFRTIVLPPLVPVILTGIALAFARGVGEYGSVIFIAGNMPGVSEIVPLFIVTRLEQFDYAGAAAVAVVMLAASFVLLLVINLLQRWSRRRHGG